MIHLTNVVALVSGGCKNRFIASAEQPGNEATIVNVKRTCHFHLITCHIDTAHQSLVNRPQQMQA